MMMSSVQRISSFLELPSEGSLELENDKKLKNEDWP